MSLKNAIDKLKFDARMIDINVKNQILNPADMKKHLEKLPDLASNSISLELSNNQSSDDDLSSDN